MRKTSSGDQKSPEQNLPLYCCCGAVLIVDTAICHLPKGVDKEVDPIRYQTLCPSCGAIGSVMLTEKQLKVFIDEEDAMMEGLLVSGKI